MAWSTTWAFVVMPDHLHWLVALKEADLSRLVLRVKFRSNRDQLRSWPERTGVAAGFSRPRDTTGGGFGRVARYVVAHPVRAGLEQSVGDYPHWDARWV
ncbi:MAG: hypothetical protein N838_20610 [Thiohalocapsa sp. PB-PSB1]|nr:MAG: hypothetical protein N838_20610 [Thiohalocapsa sp. PB-PSB1]